MIVNANMIDALHKWVISILDFCVSQRAALPRHLELDELFPESIWRNMPAFRFSKRPLTVRRMILQKSCNFLAAA
jgi:hypothetical protein